MISEDGEGVAGKCTCGYVEYCRKHLTCNLVHIWNHQKQTLGSGESAGKSTCLKRSVNGTGGTCFTLHLGNLYGLAPKVLLSCS